MKLIGDVHAKYGAYKKLIKDNRDTIQIGDLGLGFRRWPHGEYLTNPPYDEMVKVNAMFIRGNHDNPGTCRNNTQWIEDGHIEGDVMFIGGAFSIDYMFRYNGFSWWDDEQCSPEEFLKFFEEYQKVKPRMMITHDCPKEIVKYIHNSEKVDLPPSLTNMMFDNFWQAHQPDLWVFGHHHNSFDQVMNGTRFVCLAELEMREF